MSKKKNGEMSSSGISPAEEKRRREILSKLAKATGDKECSDMRFANERLTEIEVISTGNAELDRITTPEIYERTGKGGVPRGFLCEFFGPHAGGKSSLCMMIAARATSQGQFVFWADAEGSFVESWVEAQGVDLNYVIRSETGKTGEKYLEEMEAAASSGNFALVVCDSLTALQPQKILETDLSKDPRIGAVAQMMSRSGPRLVAAARKGNCSIIFINQIRNKIGIVYGNPETTPGGEALKFYSSLRMRLSQVSNRGGRGIMKDGEEIGIRSNVQIVKSRFGPPYKEVILSIYYGTEKPHPIDMLIDLCLANKLIKSRSKKDKDTEEVVQHFSIDGHDSIVSIPGMDEFKNELLAAPNEIKELARRLVEERKTALGPDIVAYVDGLGKDPAMAGS